MKFRVKRQRGGYCIEGRTEKNEELVYSQAQLLAAGDCASLLPGAYTQKGKTYVFTYSDGESAPFSKVVKREDNDTLLEGCLLSLLEMSGEFEKHGLLMRRTCFEPELAFYHKGQKRLKFAYAPIMGKTGGQADAMLLFSRLIQVLKCQSEDAKKHQAMATDFFRGNVIFSAVQYRAFLSSLGLQPEKAQNDSPLSGNGQLAGKDVLRKHDGSRPSRPYDFIRETHEQTGQVDGAEPMRILQAPVERTSRVLANSDADEGISLLCEVNGATWYLHDGKNVLGRSVNADVSLPEFRQISARHAIIEVRNAQCLILDDDSSNGTFVNGQSLSSGVPYAIAPGDQIMLADVPFLLQ